MDGGNDQRRCELAEDAKANLCESCLARHHGVCGALSSDQLRRLHGASSKVKAPAGRELIGPDRRSDDFANIVAGVVKLSKLLPDGRQQIVGLQFAPDFVGRPFGRQGTTTAEAATEVELCRFPRSALEAMVAESPELEHKLYAQALAELDEARDLLLALGRKAARERVATLLVLLLNHCQPGKPREAEVTLDLPLSRGEIADFLGLTIETVSRQFSALRRDGIIALEGARRVRIPSLAALEAQTGA